MFIFANDSRGKNHLSASITVIVTNTLILSAREMPPRQSASTIYTEAYVQWWQSAYRDDLFDLTYSGCTFQNNLNNTFNKKIIDYR